MAKVRANRTSCDRNGLSVSQSLRRRKYLLSGLLRCGKCGGNLTIAGTASAKRYYCANAKEKGPAVCTGMGGLSARLAEEVVLHGLRRELMTDEAYGSFKAAFTRHLREAKRAATETVKVRDEAIRKLESEKRNLINAIKGGRASDILLGELDDTARRLDELLRERSESTPPNIDLPDDLPTVYRRLVRDLIGTLNDEGVAGRASDSLRDMITEIIVTHEPEKGYHILEVFGNIVAMLTLTNPDERAAYDWSKRSIKLVAGARFGQYLPIYAVSDIPPRAA